MRCSSFDCCVEFWPETPNGGQTNDVHLRVLCGTVAPRFHHSNMLAGSPSTLTMLFRRSKQVRISANPGCFTITPAEKQMKGTRRRHTRQTLAHTVGCAPHYLLLIVKARGAGSLDAHVAKHARGLTISNSKESPLQGPRKYVFDT